MGKSRRAALLSAIIACLCLVLIIGGTYALFSDSVTVNNHLAAGKLKVGLKMVGYQECVLGADGSLVTGEAEETDIEIKPEDLKIDVMRAGGPGGQCVNTTDSAVRLTHIPTGLVVICQDEKSQIKNKAKALRVLRSRLYEMEEEKKQKERSQQRKSQVGSGDRSERIRTYNFPQGRVTDHRINLTLYKLDAIMNGDLDDLIEPLKIAAGEEALKEL